MEIKLGETHWFDAIVTDSSGAAADADSTPTAEVFEEDTDTAILAPTVTKRTSKTGNYRCGVVCSGANGFEAGKSYSLILSATVGGVSTKGPIANWKIRARSVDDVLPTSSYVAPLDAAGTRAALGLAAANLDTQLSALAAFVDTEIAAIMAKTDNLPSDPADASVIAAAFTAIEGALATLSAYVDTEVAAIKAKTDNLPASPAAVGSAMTLTSGERDAVAAALLDLADAIETSVTVRAALRVIATAVAGNQANAAGPTPEFTNPAGTKTRVSGTVDAQGNRTDVAWDGS